MTLRLTEAQASRLIVRNINCASCGAPVERGPQAGKQKYCRPCSEASDLRRKSAARVVRNQEERSLGHEVGSAVSRAAARSITFGRPAPEMLWVTRIAVPFSYAASKNHIYTMKRSGHVALRSESRAIKDEITDRIREAVAKVPIVHNKLWIDILVQKPNHRGDAINVLDLVADAIRKAVPMDDRWFSVRSIDWEVVRENPMLFIGIGQDADHDVQMCSYCGQPQPLTEFKASKQTQMGVGRECKTCLQAVRQKRKERRAA